MNCNKFKEYLDNYENLTEAEKSEMISHTLECADCKSEFDFFMSVVETVKSLPKIEPPSDFMDKLNARISAEERENNRLSRRILNNVRRNYRQYAAAAACFALVAVIVSNGKLFTDSMNRGDDAVTDNSVLPITDTTPPPSLPDNIADASAVQNPTSPTQSKADVPAQRDGNKADASSEKPTSGVQAASSGGTKVSASSSSVSTESGQRTASYAAGTENLGASAPGEADTSVSDSETQTDSEPITSQGTDAPSYNSGYEGYMIDEPMGMRIAQVPEDEENLPSSYDIDDKAAAMLAKIPASDVPNESSDIAVGKLRISSDSEETAMSVIERYSYNIEDEMYAVNAENFANMLSLLNLENVEYADYTIQSGGIVRFRVDVVE